MTLEEVRKSIDELDAEIVRRLGKRFELALMAKKFKTHISDPGREKQVLASVKKVFPHFVSSEFSERLYAEIFAESKRLQGQNLTLMGFQGEHGAYGELGIRMFDIKAVAIPCAEFAEVFERVREGELDLGIVPVENSTAGAVSIVDDLLIETDLKIVGEIIVPIRHCLLALPGISLSKIEEVYSHPQALSQCHGFLTANNLKPVPFSDTAGAALMLSMDRPKSSAVIASRLCADLYGLEVIGENIEDHKLNATRFLVISKWSGKEKGNKCSIVFSTSHKAGALLSVLKLFADNKINLTRIESRPILKEYKKFAFLLDFQGSADDEKVVQVMEKIKQESEVFKFLGCYKEAILGEM